jgi:predicted transcriptional regulator
MPLFRLDRKGRGTVLGPLEDQVMQIVWAAGKPVPVSEVHRALHLKKKDVAYSTVKAILTNLSAKGYVKKRSEGKSNVFSAAISREDFKEKVVKDLLASLSRDYRNPLMAHLVDQLATDAESLDQLEKLIAAKRAEAASHE